MNSMWQCKSDYIYYLWNTWCSVNSKMLSLLIIWYIMYYFTFCVHWTCWSIVCYMQINELQFANLICVVSTKGCNLVLYSFWNYHDINFERNFCWWISDDEELIKLLKKYKDLEIGGLFFFSRTFHVSYSWLTQNGHKLVNDSTDTR